MIEKGVFCVELWLFYSERNRSHCHIFRDWTFVDIERKLYKVIYIAGLVVHLEPIFLVNLPIFRSCFFRLSSLIVQYVSGNKCSFKPNVEGCRSQSGLHRKNRTAAHNRRENPTSFLLLITHLRIAMSCKSEFVSHGKALGQYSAWTSRRDPP